MTTKPMATTPIMITMVTLLISLLESSCSTTMTLSPNDNRDLRVAMEEMQKANYFTFVMLLNMSPLDTKFLANITFLMPNDRMLSKTVIPENEIHAFLQRHSIPSQLIFEHLLFVPTGSILPSSLPEYAMNVVNGGTRRGFVLNNVRIISPNICTAGSIRCHGVDGVLSPVSNISLHTCSNNGGSVAPLSSPADSLPPLSPPAVPLLNPLVVDFMAPAPQPAGGSPGRSQFSWDEKVFKVIITTILVPLVIGVSI
ncbi:Cellulose synthase-like D3 [Hibiscus syriacus]|uniref:Cellulose synthase-like D3 n=1 Tax=Hibiscus syriacus TaxID=106335 RepID=A0A6A3BUI6_HIBSY|nr:uncharacterized protein LOC120209755 [Hibiscus syriacus]KAE8720393.1 Cellulose synthase-like D3 [Hibiscus syriacus]